jgi:RNA polymerase sigma factor (sigma-70 family)
MSSTPTVFVVDDDPAVRDSLRLLLQSAHLPVATFASAQEFLAGYDRAAPGCLVLDVRMPGQSGLELQEELAARGLSLPVIIITGHGDVPMAVRAMKLGAVDFIEKPYNAQVLLERVRHALQEDARRRQEEAERTARTARLNLLTPREREVLRLLAAGKATKGIAALLGISRRTVEVHRAKIMQKMQVESIAALIRIALEAGRLEEPPP